MNKREIIFVLPVFQRRMWGGTKIREMYGYEIPSDDIGECWMVSAHENGDCVVSCGEFAGISLSQLWKSNRELFGYIEADKFPLLVKIIDAKEDISIQVHPDDDYALEHENGSMGKMESWYILDCKKDSSIVVGHNAESKSELRAMIYENRWAEFIREIPIHKGDFIQINPGTVHSINAGTLLLEVEQNSDIIYRVYDYGRRINGKLRELHLSKSIDVIKVPYMENETIGKAKPLVGGKNVNLVSCKHYSIWKLDVKEEETYKQDREFLICSVIEGEGSIDGTAIRSGSSFILPYEYGLFTIKGNLVMICTAPVKRKVRRPLLDMAPYLNTETSL